MPRTTSRSPSPPGSLSAGEPLLPLRFPPDFRLTPEPFALVCAENRVAVLALTADGRNSGRPEFIC